MVQQENPSASHFSPFEEIRRESKDGNEYWSANGLAEILGYISREKFSDVIEKAEIACINSGQPISDQFIYVDEMIGAKLSIKDIHLSRYACYLVVQNADPSNENVALGQTYFAIQTRRQELADKLAAFPEEQKRLYPRSEMSTHNRQLAESARDAGVIKAQDFAVFQDHGYMGLYSGLRAQEIHTLKGLKQ